MNTYAVYKDGQLIKSGVHFKDVKVITGMSDSMVKKCVNTGCDYKKTYTVEIDGEDEPTWVKEIKPKWDDARFRLNPSARRNRVETV